MDPILEIIDKALSRKKISDAAASNLAVGHPSLIKNMRIPREGEKRYNLPALMKLAKVLDLDFYFGPRREQPPMSVEADDFIYIRRYDVNLSAGPGMIPVENAEADQLAFSRAWMRREGLNGRNCGLLRVRGDSMHPTVQDGAMVLVEISDEPITREGIYALCRDGAAFVKRLIPINTGKDGRATSLVILSDNSAYPPDVLVGEALNEIRIVGRIRCAMTTF
jgi:phage repressor protein C with HTH and peptisase S24 domain